MCPNDCFTHRRWNFPFFFCPCRIAANSLCHSRRFCQSVVFGCLLLFQFSGLIKIDCKQHIQSLTRVSDSLVEGAIKEWSLPPTRWVLMDLLKTTGVMPGDLEDFLGKSGYETWTGFELVFWFSRGSGLSTLRNRAVFHNLEYFGEGEGATKESGPASRHREGCP